MSALRSVENGGHLMNDKIELITLLLNLIVALLKLIKFLWDKYDFT